MFEMISVEYQWGVSFLDAYVGRFLAHKVDLRSRRIFYECDIQKNDERIGSITFTVQQTNNARKEDTW